MDSARLVFKVWLYASAEWVRGAVGISASFDCVYTGVYVAVETLPC